MEAPRGRGAKMGLVVGWLALVPPASAARQAVPEVSEGAPAAEGQVISAISILRAMLLLELPSMRQRRINFSRGDNSGAIGSSVATKID